MHLKVGLRHPGRCALAGKVPGSGAWLADAQASVSWSHSLQPLAVSREEGAAAPGAGGCVWRRLGTALQGLSLQISTEDWTRGAPEASGEPCPGKLGPAGVLLGDPPSRLIHGCRRAEKWNPEAAPRPGGLLLCLPAEGSWPSAPPPDPGSPVRTPGTCSGPTSGPVLPGALQLGMRRCQ